MESCRAIVRDLQEAIENTELTKESYHGVTLLIEVLFRIYEQNQELLREEWTGLITFNWNVFAETIKESMAPIVQTQKKVKISEKAATKQKRQLNECINVLFFNLCIRSFDTTHLLPGFYKVIETVLEDLQSSSMEITSTFFDALSSRLIPAQEGELAPCSLTRNMFKPTLELFTMMHIMLDKKNLDTDGSESVRMKCFESAHLLFSDGLSLLKASHEDYASIVLPLVESVKNLCASKIGNSSAHFSKLLQDYVQLTEFLKELESSQLGESTCQSPRISIRRSEL